SPKLNESAPELGEKRIEREKQPEKHSEKYPEKESTLSPNGPGVLGPHRGGSKIKRVMNKLLALKIKKSGSEEDLILVTGKNGEDLRPSRLKVPITDKRGKSKGMTSPKVLDEKEQTKIRARMESNNRPEITFKVPR